jgi:ribosomal protein L37AE/L43A
VKIQCTCGALIIDQSDHLPHKAHLIPDQEWDAVMDAIDHAIERSAPGAQAKSAACRAAREALIRAARMAWQCRDCGRLWIDDQEHQAHEFVPAAHDAPREIFRSRASPGG